MVQCADDLQCADRLWQHSEGPLDRHGAARHRAVAPGARRAGDAYHTAIICSRLDLPRGIAEYKQALQSHADGFHGDPPAGCISRSVFHGYATREAAIEAMTSRENHCPKCGKSMRNGRWISQQGHRYMTMAECAEHGRYLIRIRVSDEPGGTQRASRLVYEGDSEAAQKYDTLAARPSAARRRRRRRSAAAPPPPKAASRKRNNKSLSKSIFDKLSNETRFTGLSFEKGCNSLQRRRARPSHVCEPSGIFSDVHAAGENDFTTFFAPAGANSARLF